MALRARDAMSDRVVRVEAEDRPGALGRAGGAAPTHAAVFDEGRFLGVAALHRLRAGTCQRIFADLAEPVPGPAVAPDEPLEACWEALSASGAQTLAVAGPDGAFAGLLTRGSLVEALLAESRRKMERIRTLKAREERLRIIGQLACGVCHDLNNILQPLLFHLDLLDDETTAGDEAAEALACVRAGAYDAAASIRRLMEFYSPLGRGGEKEDLNLDALVRDVVRLTRPKWHHEALSEGKTVRVAVEQGGVPPLRADPLGLRNALANLIFNAVDALEGDGEVRIRTFSSNGWTGVEVADTGRGMTEEVRRDCCEPFFTTKGEQGTGMGLFCCRGVAEAHGGRIELSPARGGGTRALLLLPSQQESLAAHGPEAPAEGEAGEG